jgi:hypothetical protein
MFDMCMRLALFGEYDLKEMEKAFSEVVEELAELAGVHNSITETTNVAAGISRARFIRSGSSKGTKRKLELSHYNHGEPEENLYEELLNVDFVLSRVFLLDLDHKGELLGEAATGVDFLVKAAIAASAAAVKCMYINKDEYGFLAMKIITKAMAVVACIVGSTRADAPLLNLTSHEE